MDRAEYVLAVLAASNGAQHTPVQVQKLFFLLDKKIAQHIGGEKFHFRPDDYGPFDSSVYRDLEMLAVNRLVEIESVPDLRRRVYRTTPDGQEAGERNLEKLDNSVQAYVRDLSHWVRSLGFAQLVTSIYAQYPEMKVNSVFRHTH